MAFYLSPLVDVKEEDLTLSVPVTATSIAVTVLENTYKGPERERIFVSNLNQLIDTFGEPNDDSYEDILTAAGFLNYGNMLYCTRVMPSDATFGGIRVLSGGTTDDFSFPYTYSDIGSPGITDPDNFQDEADSSIPGIFQFISKFRGDIDIRIGIVGKDEYDLVKTGQSSTITGDLLRDVQRVDTYLEDTSDFIILVSSKEQSSVDTYLLREWFVCSTTPEKKNDFGESMFMPNVLNVKSKFIRGYIGSDIRSGNIDFSFTSYASFGGGVVGDTTANNDSAIQDAFNLYSNAEEIDVNLFIDSNKSDDVKKHIDEICRTTRKDSFAILDCVREHVIENRGLEATSLVSWLNDTIQLNSSYCAVYGNWLEVYDKWYGGYRWIPASGHVAGIFANTDSVSDPWFAPAGIDRGTLRNVRKIAWNPTLGERNLIYSNNVNPIASFTGKGKIVWGQKTTYKKPSAFDRINVRRLFLTLEKSISTAAVYSLFEQNDEFTRLALINMIDPFLRDVKARRGVNDYDIVCDSRNNTPERIDRNELYCDIYIQPTRSAEFIILTFVATKTGASFDEIVQGKE